jgi:hypothetical protein
MSAGLGTSSGGPRISIKGGRFRIKDGDLEEVLEDRTLNVIIVGANPAITKSWYKDKWSKDAEPTGPACYSMDGVRPAQESEYVQAPLCASCPQNQWGSVVTDSGTKLKACSDQKRIAVVAANDPGGAIYLLQISPAALKGFYRYGKELAVRGIPPEAVITELSFDSDESFPKLSFRFTSFVTEDVYNIVAKLPDSSEVKDVTGEQVPMAVVIPEAPKKNLVKAKTVEDMEAAPVASTNKPRGFGAAKAKPVEDMEAAPVAPTSKPRGFGATAIKEAVSPPVKTAKEPPAVAASSTVSLEQSIMDLVGDFDEDAE